MKFHEYRTLKSGLGTEYPDVRRSTLTSFYNDALSRIADGSSNGKLDRVVTLEASWVHSHRPFYNVYPAVINALSNTSLRVLPSQIGDVQCTAINFPVGHEVQYKDRKATSFLFLNYIAWFDPIAGKANDSPVLGIAIDSRSPDGRPFFSTLEIAGDHLVSDACLDISNDDKRIFSLAIGVALLARDARFAEPILLQRDVGKTFATPEDKQRAIDRAIRNGRNGMTIGKDIEVSPHCRRPHFGIRWTEKGHSVPRLVPINGCLVNRSKLFPIPTGYLGEEENSDSVAITSATSSASAPADPTLIEPP